MSIMLLTLSFQIPIFLIKSAPFLHDCILEVRVNIYALFIFYTIFLYQIMKVKDISLLFNDGDVPKQLIPQYLKLLERWVIFKLIWSNIKFMYFLFLFVVSSVSFNS